MHRLRDALALKDGDRVIATRERMAKSERSVHDTNLLKLSVRYHLYPAKSIFDYLKGKKILVRHFNSAGVGNFLRISVGTDMEMDKLVSALKEFIGLNE